jgi:hypothetical protein
MWVPNESFLSLFLLSKSRLVHFDVFWVIAVADLGFEPRVVEDKNLIYNTAYNLVPHTSNFHPLDT